MQCLANCEEGGQKLEFSLFQRDFFADLQFLASQQRPRAVVGWPKIEEMRKKILKKAESLFLPTLEADCDAFDGLCASIGHHSLNNKSLKLSN